jgi:hypothetical protein
MIDFRQRIEPPLASQTLQLLSQPAFHSDLSNNTLHKTKRPLSQQSAKQGWKAAFYHFSL